jgi:hypothetical protein
MNALQEVKAVELELGDTLDITLPPDYVSYVRISYVNPETGELMFFQKTKTHHWLPLTCKIRYFI